MKILEQKSSHYLNYSIRRSSFGCCGADELKDGNLRGLGKGLEVMGVVLASKKEAAIVEYWQMLSGKNIQTWRDTEAGLMKTTS